MNSDSHFNNKLYRRYEQLARTRLSQHYILRDFLFSTEAAVAGHSNFPSDNIEQVIESGKALCEKVLEPIRAKFGHCFISFGYQARPTMERTWTPEVREVKKLTSSPHSWDRGTFGQAIYARCDLWPVCVEDGLVSKEDFARWCMMNLDIDLLMMWRSSNVFCITISPEPRRVWLEWVRTGEGDNGSNKIEWMGRDYWQKQFPNVEGTQRPKFQPSATNGRMNWSKKG